MNFIKQWLAIPAVITILLLAAANVQAAAYIKIPDIKGEAVSHIDDTPQRGVKATVVGKKLKILKEDGSSYFAKSGTYRLPKYGNITLKRGLIVETTPRDAASGLATGKRQHKPVSTKTPGIETEDIGNK